MRVVYKSNKGEVEVGGIGINEIAKGVNFDSRVISNSKEF